MIKKKDPVFWWTWGIFTTGLVLFAVTQMDIFFILIVIAFLMKPTLASVGMLKKYTDERELSINFRSGNIAFFVLMIACVFMAAKLRAENDHAYEMIYMIIVLGLVTKALVYILMAKDFRKTAPKIMITAGILIASFSGMGSIDHGVFSMSFIMNTLPGFIIIGVGILSKFYPRIAAVLIVMMALFISYFIFRRGLGWSSVGTAFIVLTPLIGASYGLWYAVKEKEE